MKGKEREEERREFIGFGGRLVAFVSEQNNLALPHIV